MKIIYKEHPTLYTETHLTRFLGISPLDPEGWDRSLDNVRNRDFNRKELSELLYSYNQSLGNDNAALENINLLKNSDAFCVFTGQQLGLMGGPAYTVLKAITALSLARKHRAVPIFWLATEDHDIDEIDHAYLLEALGNLKKFHLSLPKDGRSVEDLQITPEHLDEIKTFCKAVEQNELISELSEETFYSRLMAKVLVKLFKGTGLVFIEPRLLRPLGKEFFKKEIEKADVFSRILVETTRRYEEAGGKPQLEITTGTNLFLKNKGKYRSKIIWDGEKYFAGKNSYTKEDLLSLIEQRPELFSTNASARTVLQSLLFPTVAYVAGPGEFAYYPQLKDYHEHHGIAMPWIFPRMSATFITPEGAEMLDKCHLKPWEEIPHYWSEVIPNIETGIEETTEEWLKSGMSHFSHDISPEALTRFVRNSTRQLKRKICMIRLKKLGIPSYSLHYLRNLIHPHEKLQERVINWWEFQSHSGENLVHELIQNADAHKPGHYYCYL